jgi:hypothetical protein
MWSGELRGAGAVSRTFHHQDNDGIKAEHHEVRGAASGAPDFNACDIKAEQCEMRAAMWGVLVFLTVTMTMEWQSSMS